MVDFHKVAISDECISNRSRRVFKLRFRGFTSKCLGTIPKPLATWTKPLVRRTLRVGLTT